MRGARQKVLVVPEGGLYLAFRLLPILRRAGLEVEVLCLPKDPVARSRYVSRVCTENSPRALAQRLARHLADPARPWSAVIVTEEKLARRLMATGDQALLSAWQPGALDPQTREFLLSKFGLVLAREQWGLPIPPSRVCECLRDVMAFGEDAGWPIMLKPPDLFGGAGVRRVDSPGALEAERAALAFPLLAQRFVRGRTGVVDLVCSQGRPLAWLTSYSIRKGAGGLGPSSARLFQAMPALTPIIQSVAERTRFEGFCGFDWIEEESSGQHWLTEFHPRPPSGFRFGKYCGVDFSAAARGWITGAPLEGGPLIQQPGCSVPAHYFAVDLMRCLRERNWPALKAWLPGSGSRHDVFWDDWPLLCTQTWRRIASRWKSRAPSMAEEYELADESNNGFPF